MSHPNFLLFKNNFYQHLFSQMLNPFPQQQKRIIKIIIHVQSFPQPPKRLPKPLLPLQQQRMIARMIIHQLLLKEFI
jgi:hypothetical protein